jgi:hypothetical protein
MSAIDLAWAAGFFDGEGTFSRFGPTPGASISQVGLESLDVFAHTVGCGTVSGPYEKATAEIRRKPQWIYYAYGVAAEAVFWLLLPWLGPAKRAQGNRAIRLPTEPAARLSEATWGEQIAWAAGFFDAEGCFSVCGDALNARITHTDAQLLHQFQDALGFGKIYGPYRPHPTTFGVRNQFVYTISGFERVQALMAMLWVYLSSSKRLKAMTLLNDYRFFWKCGHSRGPVWKDRCPRCSKKTGPKPGSMKRMRSVAN